PECCTNHLKELLFFTEDLLTKHGIFHWLDYGSLLGALRNQEIIPWDTDVDFGFLKADMEKVLALKSKVSKAGYYFDESEPDIFRICYSKNNRQHVDLFSWGEKNGQMHSLYYKIDYFDFPPQYLNKLEKIILYGKAFPVPSSIHKFMIDHRYGLDYMTPRRTVVLSQIPDISPNEFTPLVGQLLDEIRERDYRIWQLENHIPIRKFLQWSYHS
ncbi:LicD-like protein, partial [Candidatus Thiomargarita nelsonii]